MTKISVQVPAQLLSDVPGDNRDGPAEEEAQVPHPALTHPDSGEEYPQLILTLNTTQIIYPVIGVIVAIVVSVVGWCGACIFCCFSGEGLCTLLAKLPSVCKVG